jgi:hypothetical protein
LGEINKLAKIFAYFAEEGGTRPLPTLAERICGVSQFGGKGADRVPAALTTWKQRRS